MTTMGYLLEDQSLLVGQAVAAFNRRKQLCPFELTAYNLTDVMHPPHVALRIRELVDTRPKALHWDKRAFFILPTGDQTLPHIKVLLVSKHSMPLAVNWSGPPEMYIGNSAADIDCWPGPQTIRMLDWAWKAVQVELENRWALRIIRQLVKKTTTHQQVHRYMPELYNLLAQQQGTEPKNSWSRHRIVEVHKALGEIGSTRATKIELPNVTVKDRANLKTMVAQVLMLKPHDGLGVGSEFDDTWVDLPK